MYSFGEYPQFAKKIDDSDLLQALESNVRLPLPEDCPLKSIPNNAELLAKRFTFETGLLLN